MSSTKLWTDSNHIRRGERGEKRICMTSQVLSAALTPFSVNNTKFACLRYLCTCGISSFQLRLGKPRLLNWQRESRSRVIRRYEENVEDRCIARLFEYTEIAMSTVSLPANAVRNGE